MGGHGGLNILPQKRWNVYNYENREKVRRDEEEAAREEQLKREQARKRDAEFRLERLRAARGLVPLNPSHNPHESEPSDSGHINLFDGIKIFDPIQAPEKEGDGSKKMKKMKKEDAVSKIVTPEDEKFRLGYGVAGKGVKLPWYLEKPTYDVDDESSYGDRGEIPEKKMKKSGKKTLEELREERLKRERREKERERALRLDKYHRDRDVFGSRRFSRR